MTAPAPAPKGDDGEIGEPRTIVVGFNDSPASVVALDWAGAAARRLDARLNIVWVMPSATAWELAAVQVDPDKRRRQMLHTLHEACSQHLDPPGTAYDARVVEGSPTSVLRQDASSQHALLLVVGASHRGAIGDLVIGSVAHDLAHDAPVPVVVVPPTWVADSVPT